MAAWAARMMGQCQCPQLAAKSLLRHDAGGVERAGDDAHGLLRVVAAVPQAVGRGREQLQLAEELVHLARGFLLEDPGDGDHQAEAEDEAHDGRNHDEDQSLGPAAGQDDLRAQLASHEGWRRAPWPHRRSRR